VVDLRDRYVKAGFVVAGEPDVLAYDAGLAILYVATESGLVHLFRVSSGAVDQLGAVDVGPNAHTVAVDPASHDVYFPLREAGGRPVLRVMRPAPYGPGHVATRHPVASRGVVGGTFTIRKPMRASGLAGCAPPPTGLSAYCCRFTWV
jgi:hypothetical protein